jgi:hypothetical protein
MSDTAAGEKVAAINSRDTASLEGVVQSVKALLGAAGEQLDAGDVVVHGAQLGEAANGTYPIVINVTVYKYEPKGVHRALLEDSKAVADAAGTTQGAAGDVFGGHRRGLLQQGLGGGFLSSGLESTSTLLQGTLVSQTKQSSGSCPWHGTVVDGHCSSGETAAPALAAVGHGDNARFAYGVRMSPDPGMRSAWLDALSEVSAVMKQAGEALSMLSSSGYSRSSTGLGHTEDHGVHGADKELRVSGEASLLVEDMGLWRAASARHRALLADSFASELDVVQAAIESAGATGVVMVVDGQREEDAIAVSCLFGKGQEGGV